jgi:hypothetical protein
MSEEEAAELASSALHFFGCECEALPSRHHFGEEGTPGRGGEMWSGGDAIR